MQIAIKMETPWDLKQSIIRDNNGNSYGLSFPRGETLLNFFYGVILPQGGNIIIRKSPVLMVLFGIAIGQRL